MANVVQSFTLVVSRDRLSYLPFWTLPIETTKPPGGGFSPSSDSWIFRATVT